MIRKEDIIKIGVFTKPHGIKGEIGLATSNDVFHASDDSFVVCDMDGILVPFFIESVRRKTSTVLLLKLAMVDSEDAARNLAGKDAFCPIDLVEEDTVSEVTWDSLIGYAVSDSVLGLLGVITDVDDSTINILLQISMDDRELLIPAVDEWIHSVDHRRRNITVSIPEGLLDM